MKKLLYAALILTIIGCGGGDNIEYLPCITCEEQGQQERYGYCLHENFYYDDDYCGYMEVNVCYDRFGGEFYDYDICSLLSSSSVSSSSSAPSIPIVSDCEGITFKKVDIGTQTWMAENLNCNIKGSKCYNNQESNCDIYGRLYDWTTAMNLPESCNSSSCYSQVNANRKGICPTGWHIPSRADWNTLTTYVEENKGCSDCAAKLLKANNGWSNSRNGLDAYGFTALPGGVGYSDGRFDIVGKYGRWWDSTEDGGYLAHYFDIYYDYDEIWSIGFAINKNYLFSVRCLQDNSSSSTSSSSSVVLECSLNGSPVKIGEQVWMSENLNCNVSGSKCYDNDPANCDKYGRLYNWAIAMNLPESCNDGYCSSQIKLKHQGICPSGWHIPNNADWNALIKFIEPGCSNYSSCGGANKLKSTSLWEPYSSPYYTSNTNKDSDKYGFSALPGGTADSDGGGYGIGEEGWWWSANDSDDAEGHLAKFRSMSYRDDNVYGDGSNTSKSNWLSVRCLQD